jgi:diaminopimelate epimerase
MSGNGTRCAAAFLLREGLVAREIRIRTGAGLKTLRLLEHTGLSYMFEMNMGRAEIRDLHFALPLGSGPRDAVILWVGNPQCSIPVSDFDFDWQAVGAEIESHPHFPNRTNVSFVRPVDEHTIDVRFYERGAGVTMSSGTGSTGAAAAAVARGIVRSPVRVLTPAGALDLRMEEDIFLTGPAVLTAQGRFFV